MAVSSTADDQATDPMTWADGAAPIGGVAETATPLRDTLPDDAIKHVVVLMLEKRGFDHLMGWLYPPAAEGAPPAYTLVSRDDDQRPFIGLSTLSPAQLAALSNPAPSGDLMPINKGARSPKSPAYKPGQRFEQALNQQWGVALTGDEWSEKGPRGSRLAALSKTGTLAPPMTGYVLDYGLEASQQTKTHLSLNDLSEVLDTYLPRQVPVLSGLARAYAVSDEWFCSAPSQAGASRAFSMTGVSRDAASNSGHDPSAGEPSLAEAERSLTEPTRNLFEVLQEAKLSWKVYWQSEWPAEAHADGARRQYTRATLPRLLDGRFDGNFERFDAGDHAGAFFRDARAGELPAVSWIEPHWGGGPEWYSTQRVIGNDYHPVSDTTVGEDFVMNVYQALAAGPRETWESTLLIITFDESGGTYDHVPPPGPTPHAQPGLKADPPGGRVPTLLVSPRIAPGTLFRSTEPGVSYDHASLIASILKLAQAPKDDWGLGERVANAPTIEGLIIQPSSEGVASSLNHPARPLSIPDDRSQGAELRFGANYILEYVGDPFWRPSGPVYLGRSGFGVMPTYNYPTLSTDPAEAHAFTFKPPGGAEPTHISNMSLLRIATTEHSRFGWILMTAPQASGLVHYTGDRSLATTWQIRLLGSREREDIVREGDLVYFVSQSSSPASQSGPGQVTPDPVQRLAQDARDSKHVTTRAGEWALWRIRPHPSGV